RLPATRLFGNQLPPFRPSLLCAPCHGATLLHSGPPRKMWFVNRSHYNNRLQQVRMQLGTSASPNANACTVYNYYSAVTNPTTCSIPSQAATGNNRNEVGHYFQDTTNPSLGHTATMTYDNVNRLTTSVATGSATHNLTFSYDRYGNMTCVMNQQTNGLCSNYT